MTRNATSSAAEAASRATVLVEPQPTCGALEMAYTNRTRPPVTELAPNGS
jgi:hypothetical protein